MCNGRQSTENTVFIASEHTKLFRVSRYLVTSYPSCDREQLTPSPSTLWNVGWHNEVLIDLRTGRHVHHTGAAILPSSPVTQTNGYGVTKCVSSMTVQKRFSNAPVNTSGLMIWDRASIRVVRETSSQSNSMLIPCQCAHFKRRTSEIRRSNGGYNALRENRIEMINLKANLLVVSAHTQSRHSTPTRQSP